MLKIFNPYLVKKPKGVTDKWSELTVTQKKIAEYHGFNEQNWGGISLGIKSVIDSSCVNQVDKIIVELTQKNGIFGLKDGLNRIFVPKLLRTHICIFFEKSREVVLIGVT